MSLLDELASFGLDPKKDIGIMNASSPFKAEEANHFGIPDRIKEGFLYDRKSVCPVCSNTIFNKYVRSHKLRYVGSDLDYRPVYEKLDILKYDIIHCKYCGFTSLSKVYKDFSVNELRKIKEQIKPNFRGKDYIEIYDYNTAIERYKLALYNGIVADFDDVRKAYICLRIAWLYRGRISEGIYKNDKELKKESEEFEIEFLKKAYNGFMNGILFQGLPFLEIDRNRAMQICIEIDRKQGNYENALKLASKLISSKTAKNNVKDKARESKELILRAMKKEEELEDVGSKEEK